MDVFKFVLWATTKLTLAVTGLVVAGVVYLLEKITGHARTKARQDIPQQEPQPYPQHTPQASAGTPPAVHVHVHIDQAPPQPASSPSLAGPPPPAWILNHPDHRIYVTTGSHLMQEHPACDELLERLDEMLYIAAHRNGDPFTVAPPLDDSRYGGATPLDLPPVAPVDDGEFIGDEQQPMPPPDGALWFRKAGETPQRIATGTPS